MKTFDEQNKLLRDVISFVMEKPSFAKEIMDAVSFALNKKTEEAIELAHQKDMALLTAMSIVNSVKNGIKIDKTVLQKLEQDIVVHGILCSSDYENIEKRMQNLCQVELDFIKGVCKNSLQSEK